MLEVGRASTGKTYCLHGRVGSEWTTTRGGDWGYQGGRAQYERAMWSHLVARSCCFGRSFLSCPAMAIGEPRVTTKYGRYLNQTYNGGQMDASAFSPVLGRGKTQLSFQSWCGQFRGRCQRRDPSELGVRHPRCLVLLQVMMKIVHTLGRAALGQLASLGAGSRCDRGSAKRVEHLIWLRHMPIPVISGRQNISPRIENMALINPTFSHSRLYRITALALEAVSVCTYNTAYGLIDASPLKLLLGNSWTAKPSLKNIKAIQLTARRPRPACSPNSTD